MEKVLEFKKSKLFDKEKIYRFQCDCLLPSDAMDIVVRAWGEDDEEKNITLSMFFQGTGLWDRVKYAFAILKGDWAWRDFRVRQEDYPNLMAIFSDKKCSELP